MNGRQERRGVEIRTLSWQEAALIKDNIVALALERGITGYSIVADSLGRELSVQQIGDDNEVTLARSASARAKIRTVVFSHRSTTVQEKRMTDSGQTREDFNGELGNLRGGGVAIYADEELKDFRGAAAFSGGSEEIAEGFCDQAIRRTGFYTDMPQPK